MDFLMVATRSGKKGTLEIYPKFIIKKSSDLMVRGGDFYAVWLEDQNRWSTDEEDLIRLIDKELDAYAEKNKESFNSAVRVLHMWDSETGMIDAWHKYCQKQMRDSFHPLDEAIIFSNTPVTKDSYSSKSLQYPLKECETPAYERLISTLYDESERHKIEWAIGAIVTGDSKFIQKFLVFYGDPGTGKSTILNVIQQLFDGYYSTFDAKALGSSNNVFALEAFKTNPLVAIQHDGDLSHIEDNTRLNSLVSHEFMTVNEKFKSAYTTRFNSFLLMGTNKPVRISDAKSGLLRRLIDVTPSGRKLPGKEYHKIVKEIPFELPGIAYHCQQVYLDNPHAYDGYVPMNMLGASNDFYNFVSDSYFVFKKAQNVSLKTAWDMYKAYCEDSGVAYPYPKRAFKEELKNYFKDYKERFSDDNGERTRNMFIGFLYDKFGETESNKEESKDISSEPFTLLLNETESILDEFCNDCFAQYASSSGTPVKPWDRVTTKLSDINSHELHYVKLPENHIVIDFDIQDENGNKSLEKNLEAASKWPETYAELSKSGVGVHLHYIYDGDVKQLSRIFDDHIEIKVFTGKSSLRRKLTKCNNIPIRTIRSGLPLKGVKAMVDFEAIKNEKCLRSLIEKNLRKEIVGATKPSIDLIYKDLDNCYKAGMHYDVEDLRPAIIAFAANSTHQAQYCLQKVLEMKFHSEEPAPEIVQEEKPLVFFDIEVFPNLFLVMYKKRGKGEKKVSLFNPTPEQITSLMRFNLIGFNNRKYDNHLIYACHIGKTVPELYKLSHDLINKNFEGFREAYNISYTDIYDFASAGNKKSLKKLEIEMGIHHQELGLDWDTPVPEELWGKVEEYCGNDVDATEAAFDYLQADWTARKILADLAGMSVNSTTNQLTTKIIFGNDHHPQSQFNYRDLSKPVSGEQYEEYREKFGPDYKFRVFDENGIPQFRDFEPWEILPDGWSILPFFPGYTYAYNPEKKKYISTYLGQEIGEGGRVYSEPGMYSNVWDGDISSQHPHSIIAEVLFGPKFTKAFKQIVDGRVSIKHKAWSEIDEMLDGKLKPYIQKVINGEMTASDLANALKTAINSVYGLTSAKFDNPFRDRRNVDNIVAKRGALFMTLLKQQVEALGYKVCHIKTDSIKIPNADERIKEFIIKFGKEYGYSFETEAEFEKFCIVNDAVYVAKDTDGNWHATGKQFAVPYVFKTLFTKENVAFEDMCEAFEVKSALYLDMNENESSPFDNEYQKDGKHNYIFIGKVGQFCPVVDGAGGGWLLREGKDPKTGEKKYDNATGATGFRWMESEMVKTLGKQDKINREFYKKLVDAAYDTIAQYGDVEWFVNDDQSNIPPFDVADALVLTGVSSDNPSIYI